jgi:uncharacterized protein (UPF0218 family)
MESKKNIYIFSVHTKDYEDCIMNVCGEEELSKRALQFASENYIDLGDVIIYQVTKKGMIPSPSIQFVNI